ncbi:MAG: Na/Pi cotransporter family protein [Gammaproteobacteria bacterium]
MQQNLIIVGMLAGGLGLFMLAINMITNGLRSAAGHSLRDMLGKWTRSPLHGIVTGLSITAIVQSSSAVTVATIGFVNAGFISMHKALGVIYGSNIGTTMTSWLVASTGFKFNLEAFALPMIGIGMLLHLTGRETKRASLGTAVAGFGLFFIGIGVLQDAFSGLMTSIDLNQFTAQGFAAVMMYAGIGFLMTVLTQSSSAAIAIILTAATGGVVGLYAAAAMVIGANVGTTSTAAFAVIDATSNAKRVAAAHIIFNAITGVVALTILPPLFWVVNNTSELLGLEHIPAVTLALFHTIFNIFGVLLMLPLSKPMVHFLDKRFVTQEEIESRPRYLDKTVAVSPELAVHALALELSRITTITRRMGLQVLSSEFIPSVRIRNDYRVTQKLSAAVAEFIAQLERGRLGKEVSEQLAKVVRSEQHLLASANQAMEIIDIQARVKNLADEKLIGGIAQFRAEVVSLMKISNPEEAGFSFAECELQLDRVQAAYDEVKSDLLLAGAELRVPIHVVIDIIDQNSCIRRMARQMVKAMHYLSELSMIAGVKILEPEPEPAETGTEVEQDEMLP